MYKSKYINEKAKLCFYLGSTDKKNRFCPISAATDQIQLVCSPASPSEAPSILTVVWKWMSSYISPTAGFSWGKSMGVNRCQWGGRNSIEPLNYPNRLAHINRRLYPDTNFNEVCPFLRSRLLISYWHFFQALWKQLISHLYGGSK